MAKKFITEDDVSKILYLRGDLPRHQMKTLQRKASSDSFFKAELDGLERLIFDCNMAVSEGILSIDEELATKKEERLARQFFKLIEANDYDMRHALFDDFKDYLLGVERRQLEDEKNLRSEAEHEIKRLQEAFQKALSEKTRLEQEKVKLEKECTALKLEISVKRQDSTNQAQIAEGQNDPFLVASKKYQNDKNVKNQSRELRRGFYANRTCYY